MRQEAHEEMNGHIILEVDGKVAKDCGWQGPIEGVRLWMLDDYETDTVMVRRGAVRKGLARHGKAR